MRDIYLFIILNLHVDMYRGDGRVQLRLRRRKRFPLSRDPYRCSRSEQRASLSSFARSDCATLRNLTEIFRTFSLSPALTRVSAFFRRQPNEREDTRRSAVRAVIRVIRSRPSDQRAVNAPLFRARVHRRQCWRSGGDALIPPLCRKFLIYPSSRFALRLRAARD